MSIQYLPVSWNEYHSLAQKIAATILGSQPHVDEIVAISRGGLTFGHLLSDLLRVPISTITIQSYVDIQTQGEIKVTGRLQTPIEGKHVLLVDDVSDSGKTLKRAVTYLQRLNPTRVTTATIFYKPHSVFRPDFFAQQTTKWILFPYEPTEMIILITKQMTSQGKSKAQIQAFLEKLNYNQSDIAFVRKHHLAEK